MLTLSNVSSFYGKFQVLRDVSLEVAGAEIVTVVGANGAGKSTLLRAVSGMGGHVIGGLEFAGKALNKLSPEGIAALGIGHVPEGRRIFRRMTVLENLELGAYMRSDGAQIRADIKRICEYFPILAERKRQIAGTLSGGQQQMLAIGTALMARPRLLLLDEPSFGLAPLVVKEVAEIIGKIREREGATILLVEQNAGIALGLSDRAYVMETGKIVLQGKADEVAANQHVRQAYLGI